MQVEWTDTPEEAAPRRLEPGWGPADPAGLLPLSAAILVKDAVKSWPAQRHEGARRGDSGSAARLS